MIKGRQDPIDQHVRKIGRESLVQHGSCLHGDGLRPQSRHMLNIHTHQSRRLPRRRLVCHLVGDTPGGGSNQHAASSSAASLPTGHRRDVLKLASIGALHSLAGRLIVSTDQASAAAPAAAATVDGLARALDDRVREFSLPNGMRFLVSERRAAPIVSFHTYADVGAFDERDGTTGVAHFLEHLAFKGTPRVGTRDFAAEAPLLDAMDEAFYSLRDAGSPREAAALTAQLDALQAQAAALSVPNAYGSLLQRQGAVGLNAATTHDATKYFCSLPSNKLELWFALEAERFQAPVFREVYSEKKVVLEERRLRVDNSPLGAFQEEFAQRCLANNYRRPVIGYEADIQRLGRREVASFFAEHYGPAALTVAVVGDVRPSEVRRLADKYFGGGHSGAAPGAACDASSLASARPAGVAREVSMRSPAGPAVLRAWYRPCLRDAAAASALDLASDALTGSRSARLYQSLVLGGKALSVSSFANFPAEKHPALMATYTIPAPGQSTEALDALVQAEVAALAAEGPTVTELRRYSKAARMGVLEVLQSNSGLASTLASYQVLTGDWRNVSAELERIEALTPAAVAAAVQPYLAPDNSCVGYVLRA